jgi:hypothetical protein
VVGFVSDGLKAVTLLLVGLLVGCNEQNTKKESQEPKIPRHEQMNSGYNGNSDKWRGFLSCWQSALQKYDPGSPVIYNPVLGVGQLDLSAADSNYLATRGRQIEALERRLRVKLPQSYRDFLLAYRPSSKLSVQVASRNASGFLDPSHVGYLADLDPDALKVFEANPIAAGDAEYFRYGAGQDDVARRTKNLRTAVLIGRYGDAQYEIILLYPDVKTSDGEMETAMLHHSGEFRAPSFAEMMRQLSVLETRNRAGEGLPYPQRMLKQTCAEKMELANVWWN